MALTLFKSVDHAQNAVSISDMTKGLALFQQAVMISVVGVMLLASEIGEMARAYLLSGFVFLCMLRPALYLPDEKMQHR